MHSLDAQLWVGISAREPQPFMHLPPNTLHGACDCDVMSHCTPHSQLAEGCLQPLQSLQIRVKCENRLLSSRHFSPTRISRFNNIRILLLMDTPSRSENERKPHVTASKSDEGSEDDSHPPAQSRAGNAVPAAETRRSQPLTVQPPRLTQLQLTQTLLCFLAAMQMACLWTKSTRASLCKDPLCYYLYLCQILPTQAETGLYPG